MKRAVTILILVPVLAMLAVGAASGYSVWRESRPTPVPERIDAIVVMGAAQYNGRPSGVFKARLDAARALYEKGAAPLVFVLGGKRPGDKMTEAQAGTAYLERVLPASRVIGVKAGDNTYDSLSHLTGPAGDRGVKRILVVSDPFHLARSKAMAKSLGFQAFTSPSATSAKPADFLRETIMLTLFQTLRVVGSPRRG